MSVLQNANIKFGQIQYFGEIEPKPATSETTGNATINNQAIEGSPAHFEVTHMISATYEFEGLEIRNVFHWSSLIRDAPLSAQYDEVENQGAKLIPSMLRSLADQLQKDIDRVELERAEKKKAT